jgi:iron complex outermembrane receptor protein
MQPRRTLMKLIGISNRDPLWSETCVQLIGAALALILVLPAFAGETSGGDDATVEANQPALSTEFTSGDDSLQSSNKKPAASTKESDKLGVVTVYGARQSTSSARQELDKIDGGVGLVQSEELNRGRVATVQDALQFQPGVYADSVNGGEAVRLSIRGSGIVRAGFLFGFGNQLEFDGLRVYSASGNPYEAVEPLAVDHIEILRGSNGFNDGPLSLGGVIDYVTRTGYDSSLFQARVEGGSYGYHHEQVSSGQVIGDFDYYVSYTHFNDDGYRYNTQMNSNRFVGTFGDQITPDITTRFNVRYAQQDQHDAGYLTWAQFQHDPRASQYGTSDVVARVNPGSWLASNVTTWQIDPNSSLAAGLQYNNYPIFNPGITSNAGFMFDDLSNYLRYKRRDTLFGDHQSNTELSFIGYHQLTAEFDTSTPTGGSNSKRPASQSDWTVVGSNDTELVRDLWLTTGVAGTYQTRETGVTFSTGALPSGSRIIRDYTHVDPRVGLRFDLSPHNQVYANFSRSVDTPSANSYIRTTAVFSPISFIDLKPATASTAEVGTRGQESIVRWDVDYYKSWIKDELLTTQVAPGSVATITSNASPTFHEGVEAEFDVALWHTADVDPYAEAAQRIVLRQVYTWNNFHYRDDPIYGHNSLPAVPVHLYQAEAQYQHPEGFYAGVNVKASLSQYAVDYANSFYAPAYALLGARIGYEQPKRGWEVFVEGDNLTSKNYAAAVTPVYSHGATSPVFAPGVARTVTGGISYRF